jgi:GNAT superfamily N-acetyltransferase
MRASRLSVSTATQDDWHTVAEWAAAEGWNPGHQDVACFHPTDPAGFFLGRVEGEGPVSAVSVVTYSPDYAFLGFYLVRPDQRGRGLGFATWGAAVPHAGDRNIGLDAVPEQEGTYRRSGFTSHGENFRWAGVRPDEAPAPRRGAPTAVPYAPEHLDALTTYDRACFPAGRRAFLARWLTAPGHTAYVALRDGRLTGYAVIRPARDSHRIGPLFADDRPTAESLLDALTASLPPATPYCLDIPATHPEATALAQSRGLTPSFRTIRMYTAKAPDIASERVWAGTSLELG